MPSSVFIPARRRASAVLAVDLCLSVCPSVRHNDAQQIDLDFDTFTTLCNTEIGCIRKGYFPL